jgi:NAD(P)-dependent dehydrogenase (short-subunit alcohol dehydrogenase family)
MEAPPLTVAGLRFVITGAAKGIGAETARVATGRGARVLLSDVDDAAGQATAAAIRADGGDAHYVHCDVTDEQEIRRLMERAADALGGIDVLHNNAGTHESMIGSEITLDSMSKRTFERILGINLVGPFLCAKYAVPYLRRSANASIINAGSTASFLGFPQNLAYGASKGGVAMLTKNLAVDLAPDRIRVNAYCPAAIETTMVTKFVEASPEPEALKNMMIRSHLVPRLGIPRDVANLVCFLASPEASFVNGVLWLLDGGSLAWRGTTDVLGMS